MSFVFDPGLLSPLAPTPLPSQPTDLSVHKKKCQRQAGGVAVCRNARRFFSPFSLRWNAFRWIRNISFRCHFPFPRPDFRLHSFPCELSAPPTTCRVQAQNPFHFQRRSKKVLEMFYVLIAFCCLTHSPSSNQKRDQTWVSRWFNGLTSLHFPLFHFFFPSFFSSVLRNLQLTLRELWNLILPSWGKLL